MNTRTRRSKLSIINRVFGDLGMEQLTTELAETNFDYIIASNAFDDIVEEMLRSNVWNFSKNTVKLTTPDKTPETSVKRVYEFILPNDSLRVIRVSVGDKLVYNALNLNEVELGPNDIGTLPYEIQGDRIFVEGDEIELTYIRTAKPYEFDVIFSNIIVETLKLKLYQRFTERSVHYGYQLQREIDNLYHKAQQVNALERVASRSIDRRWSRAYVRGVPTFWKGWK